MNPQFVDSNILVYLMMADPLYSARPFKFSRVSKKGASSGWTSTLALGQAFSHLKKRKRYDAIEKFYDYLENAPYRSARPREMTLPTHVRLGRSKSCRGACGMTWFLFPKWRG